MEKRLRRTSTVSHRVSPRSSFLTHHSVLSCYNEYVWTEIAKHLDGKSLAMLAVANKWFHRVVMHDIIWKHVCLRQLGVKDPGPVRFKWNELYNSAFGGRNSFINRQQEKHIEEEDPSSHEVEEEKQKKSSDEYFWTEIAKHLDGKSLAMLAVANKWFHRVVMHDIIWKHVCLRQLGVKDPGPVRFKWNELYNSAFGEKKKKKTKKREKEKFLLDEDDYALLEDNKIKDFLPKKFKRLKKASLFGDDEAPLEDIGEEEEQPEEDVDLGEDVDEMADFIVDEDEHGAHVRKKCRQIHGFSSHVWQQAVNTFCTTNALRQFLNRKQGLEQNESEASEKYMTKKHDEIREIGIPVKMQIYDDTTGPSSFGERSTAAETYWIYGQLMTAPMPLLDKGIVEGAGREVILKEIAGFLELTKIHKLEVPFIAMYRKEDIPTLLQDTEQQGSDYDNQDDNRRSKMRWHKLLWAIQSLDGKWMLLQKQKAVHEVSYQKRFEKEHEKKDSDDRINLNKKVFKSIHNALCTAESIVEIEDVNTSFYLHFPREESDNGQRKWARRTRTEYSIARKSGLWMVSSKYGCISENFGQKISSMNTEALEDPRETPEEMASNFMSTSTMFNTPQDVLKAARHMASTEIKCEPCVRKHVRSIFMDKAVVSTTPTPKGNVSIDAFHQFAGVKWLREKPLANFNDTQWLLIQKAEDQKLLQVTIKLPQYDLDKLVSDAHNHYLSGGVSRSAHQWNEQRKQILDDAIVNYLLPDMVKEARLLLATRAKNWVLSDYGRVLWEKVSVAPYQRKENDVSKDEKAAPRVMACCWGPGKPATTFVMLDSSGEVLDVLHTGYLPLRSKNVSDQIMNKSDTQCVLKCMTVHKPQVVVLGAVNYSCTYLQREIYEIIYKFFEENPGDGRLPIVYGDESLPRLYENSHISTCQLPGQPGIVKRAVALGRYLQNPLAVVATMCGREREILSWKLTPSESFLNPDEKYEMIEQIMVDATNQVGHVNLAASHKWLYAPLQLFSGLIYGFRDFRKAYTEPSVDEEFHLLSGESEHTVSVGRIVRVKVQKVQAHRAICTLDDSGLTGILNKEDYADGRDIDLSEVINKDDILTCKVKIIQKTIHTRKTMYDVLLGCRESELRAERNKYLGELDPYYHEDKKISLQFEQDKARKDKEEEHADFLHRMIQHTHFQNITAEDAMKLLANKDPGESIIHPSSLGLAHLTITLKVYEDVYAHEDIAEVGKKPIDIVGRFRAWHTLQIGKEKDTFEDLDEVMDRYVNPLVTHLKAMLSYRKFKAGTKSEVDELLKIEKADNPMSIVYCFGIRHEHPGTFILTYIRSTTPRHEYIRLYPQGFEFRNMMFEDLDRLVAYFRMHIDDPQMDSALSIRSVDAMVPMQSPAPGSAAGSGWCGTCNDVECGGQCFDSQRWTTPSSIMGRSDNRNGGSRDGGWRGRGRGRGGGGRGRREPRHEGGGRGRGRGGGGQGSRPPRHDGGWRGRGRGRGGGRGRGCDNNYRSDSSGHGVSSWDNKGSGDGGRF